MSFLLFLNDVSGSEILLILLVILMFFGSKSIPGIAKSLGKALYEFRNATSEIQNEIKKSGVDIKKDLNINNLIQEKTQEIMLPMDQVFTDIENTVHYGAQDAAQQINRPKPLAVSPPTDIPKPVAPIEDVDYDAVNNEKNIDEQKENQ
jgi:sec-independent protein translocase protein TatA